MGPNFRKGNKLVGGTCRYGCRENTKKKGIFEKEIHKTRGRGLTFQAYKGKTIEEKRAQVFSYIRGRKKKQ